MKILIVALLITSCSPPPKWVCPESGAEKFVLECIKGNHVEEGGASISSACLDTWQQINCKWEARKRSL